MSRVSSCAPRGRATSTAVPRLRPKRRASRQLGVQMSRIPSRMRPPGVVDQEAAVVRPADVQLDVAAEREQLRVGGDDPLAHQVVPARGALETVGRELHRHRLAGRAAVAASDRPVARRAPHQRAVQPERSRGRSGDHDDGGRHDGGGRARIGARSRWPRYRRRARRRRRRARRATPLRRRRSGRRRDLAVARGHASTSCTS